MIAPATLERLAELKAALPEKPSVSANVARRAHTPRAVEKCLSKKPYPHRMAADATIATIRFKWRKGWGGRHRRTGQTALNSYRCLTCGFWHLTGDDV